MDIEHKFKYLNNYHNFIDLIAEGLIKTYPINALKRNLTKELSALSIRFKIELDYDTNTIIIKGFSTSMYNKDLENLFKYIALFGYYPAIFFFYDNSNKLITELKYIKNDTYEQFYSKLNTLIKKSYYTEIIIESKFNKKITPPDILYHVTKAKFKHKIFKIGLVSKSLSKKAFHSDRIYLGFDKNITENLAYQFKDKDLYILLEINVKNLHINFYDDPDFSEMGCYTYENIPPENIKLLNIFKN